MISDKSQPFHFIKIKILCPDFNPSILHYGNIRGRCNNRGDLLDYK